VKVSFTVAIPTHNRCETALLAARSALAQSRAPEQLIVLCDGCTDGTAEAMRALGDPRVEVVELPKAPGYGYEHRNVALERARGEAIVYLADDDLWMPDHLKRIGRLWDCGRFDIVQSYAVLVAPDDALELMGADWSVPGQRAAFELGNTNPMSSVSVRVELARAVGGWDGTIERAADWDLWKRALAAGARCAASCEPTVLHFRASDREQAWPLRVRQNSEWLERICDRDARRELRLVLRRTRAERDARVAEQVAWLDGELRAAHEQIRELNDGLSAAIEDAAGLAERLAAAEAERAQLAAASAQLAEKLERIESGGWWRLRKRVLPVMRMLGRGD
jgi:glycosyltransferase involved in cell wall biosynthesis